MDRHPEGGGTATGLLRKDFTDGLECLRKDDFAGALVLFRAADEGAEPGDRYQSRYTSFHGLAKMRLGDSSGIKLCRKAAAGELRDAEVYYNLALLEHRLRNRESAWMALRRGLRLDPAHAGLQRLQADMHLRSRHALIPGLARDNPLNRWLGRALRGRRRAWPEK